MSLTSAVHALRTPHATLRNGPHFTRTTFPADSEWTAPAPGIALWVPRIEIPEFHSHALIRGGHAQTLSGLFFPGDVRAPDSIQHQVALSDGDAVVIHDDVPAGWRPGGPVAVLVHGLTGSAASPYMIRTARKLAACGIRPFRMDMRSCGAGRDLARRPYHAGCSDDVLAVIQYIQARCDGGPTSLVGFSLGGNIVLKLLGEAPERLPASVVRSVAVNPSIDLAACAIGLERSTGRFYARHFVTAMHRHLAAADGLVDRHIITQRSQPVRSLREFDDLYTSRIGGFTDASDYYQNCSAGQFLPGIHVPTLILAANDDPLIPVGLFRSVRASAAVQVHLSQSGGHLGFIGRAGVDPDRRWMDWRVVDWLTAAPDA